MSFFEKADEDVILFSATSSFSSTDQFTNISGDQSQHIPNGSHAANMTRKR